LALIVTKYFYIAMEPAACDVDTSKEQSSSKAKYIRLLVTDEEDGVLFSLMVLETDTISMIFPLHVGPIFIGGEEMSALHATLQKLGLQDDCRICLRKPTEQEERTMATRERHEWKRSIEDAAKETTIMFSQELQEVHDIRQAVRQAEHELKHFYKQRIFSKIPDTRRESMTSVKLYQIYLHMSAKMLCEVKEWPQIATGIFQAVEDQLKKLADLLWKLWSHEMKGATFTSKARETGAFESASDASSQKRRASKHLQTAKTKLETAWANLNHSGLLDPKHPEIYNLRLRGIDARQIFQLPLRLTSQQWEKYCEYRKAISSAKLQCSKFESEVADIERRIQEITEMCRKQMLQKVRHAFKTKLGIYRVP